MNLAKKITAICFGDIVYKYHIVDTPAQIIKFEAFIKKKGVKYVNYYDANTKKYLRRQYMQTKKESGN
jgi:ABC-type ATPase with predicted acetyltransferase domain